VCVRHGGGARQQALLHQVVGGHLVAVVVEQRALLRRGVQQVLHVLRQRLRHGQAGGGGDQHDGGGGVAVGADHLRNRMGVNAALRDGYSLVSSQKAFSDCRHDSRRVESDSLSPPSTTLPQPFAATQAPLLSANLRPAYDGLHHIGGSLASPS